MRYILVQKNSALGIIINELDACDKKIIDKKETTTEESSNLCSKKCKCSNCLCEKEILITSFPFITDGYQIIEEETKENGEKTLRTDKLVVTGCKKYTKKSSKKNQVQGLNYLKNRLDIYNMYKSSVKNSEIQDNHEVANKSKH